LQVPLFRETVSFEPIEQELAQVLVTLVERCGMRNTLLSLAGIAYAKSVQILADEPGISDEWKAVADGANASHGRGSKASARRTDDE
jgi:hypothetical protein